MGKLNCWEFKKCGRVSGGEHEKDLGVCPVTAEKRLNGVHDGTNAGRACWVVAGTLCGGIVQGSFAKKYEHCEKCDFYQAVKKEEGYKYELAILLLKRLKTDETKKNSVS